jgi:branched-chain amino acid transport system permease protein
MPTRPLSTRYEHDLAIFRGLWPKLGLLAFVVVAVAWPFLASSSWLTVGTLALTTVVGAVALMILTGFTGQISLGHAAFLAIGAYAAAILGLRGLPFWLVLPAAGALAAAVGLAVGPFALRLRGLYLAIVTIGLLYLVKHLLYSFPEYTGGVGGIAVPMHGWFSDSGDAFGSMRINRVVGPIVLHGEQVLYFVYLAIAVAVVWMGRNLQRSNTGRAMMAVRDHDLAASALGVHPARVKIIAFGISSFLAGVAGAMFGWQQQFITIDPPFNLLLSVEYIAIIILGGLGTIFGAVVGAIFFTVVSPLAEMIGPSLPYVRALTSHQQATVIFAAVVVLFLLLEPLGLYGVWLRIKRYFATWPFTY